MSRDRLARVQWGVAMKPKLRAHECNNSFVIAINRSRSMSAIPFVFVRDPAFERFLSDRNRFNRVRSESFLHGKLFKLPLYRYM